jgi:hypothetical protein
VLDNGEGGERSRCKEKFMLRVIYYILLMTGRIASHNFRILLALEIGLVRI